MPKCQILTVLLAFTIGWLLDPSQCAPTSNNSTVIPLGIKGFKPNFDCIIRGAAPVTECAQALLQFHKDTEPAGFRQIIGHSPHRYMLPQIQVTPHKHSSSCGVLVDFHDPKTHHEEKSSWSSVIAIGSLLIQACSAPGTGVIGGWAYAGDDDYMRVTIMDSRYIPRYLLSTGTGDLGATLEILTAQNSSDSTQPAIDVA